MAKIKTHICTNSYIIEAGILSALNEIKELNYIKLNTGNISLYLKDNTDKLYFFDKNTFEEHKNIILKYKIKHLLVSDNAQKNNYINININTKSEIIEIISATINREFEQKTENKQEELSPREISIVECIAKGMTNKEIADKLFISTHTVITHRKNITKKLGIKSISGLTVYAILNNIVSINEINEMQ